MNVNEYYCRKCAILIGEIGSIMPPTLNLTGDALGYQLDKYLKHTETGYNPGNGTSLFRDPEYGNYSRYVIGACNSGCLEIDTRNRKNMVYWAGEEIGGYYSRNSGGIIYPESGVKVAFFNDEAKIHGFTCNPMEVLYRQCACCRGPLQV
jgi:hypothetical protein